MGKIEEITDEEPPRPSQDPQLHEGATVRLHSLASAAQHNGKEGTLITFDEEAGRWEVVLREGGQGLRVKPNNLSFVRAKRAFQFAPKRRPAPSPQSNGSAKNGEEQAQQGVCEELAQDAFEQVIAELGPQLRRQLGYIEDAKTPAEEAVNDRVDAAVGETLQPLLNGIEAAAKKSPSEANFTETVNQLIRDYFANSSSGGPATLAARRRDLDEEYTKNHTAFTQVEASLGPRIRESLGHVANASTPAEEAANQRVEAAAEEILKPLLDMINEAAQKCESGRAFTEMARQLTEKYFTEPSSPGSAANLAARRKQLDELKRKEAQ